MMECLKCKSRNLIRFVDVRGMRRVYCRFCKISYPILPNLQPFGIKIKHEGIIQFKY